MYNSSFYNNKRVFITGHTGFKGAWLCKMLAKEGAIVTGYSLEPATNPSLYEIAEIDKDVKSVTPGQLCALYNEDGRCLGSGIIKEVRKNNEKLWYLL